MQNDLSPSGKTFKKTCFIVAFRSVKSCNIFPSRSLVKVVYPEAANLIALSNSQTIDVKMLYSF
jgi:hypothetical protein